jgi:hypothetical protein
MEMIAPYASAIGLLGVAIVLVSYGLLTTGKLSEHDARYYWMNIIGTVGIAISLLVQCNLPSMVAQILWIVISFVALIRLRRRA